MILPAGFLDYCLFYMLPSAFHREEEKVMVKRTLIKNRARCSGLERNWAPSSVAVVATASPPEGGTNIAH